MKSMSTLISSIVSWKEFVPQFFLRTQCAARKESVKVPLTLIILSKDIPGLIPPKGMNTMSSI